jgi:hypothetical protein
LRLNVTELNAVLLLKCFQLFPNPFDFVNLNCKFFFFRLKHGDHLKANFDFVFLRNPNLLGLGFFNNPTIHFRKPVSFLLLRSSSLRFGEKLLVLDSERLLFVQAGSLVNAS